MARQLMVRRWFTQALVAHMMATFAWTPVYADDEDSRLLATTFNASGHDLLKKGIKTPGNVVLSPYSIGSAMAMALSGAHGETAKEMGSVLRHRLDRDRIDAANAALMSTLLKGASTEAAPTCPEGMSLTANGCESPKPEDRDCPEFARPQGDRCEAAPIVRKSGILRIANAIALVPGAVVSDTYINALKRNYSAEVFRIAGTTEVNSWVSRLTEGKIDRILDRQVENGIVLVDAVYFKQAWRTAFSVRQTSDDHFYLTPNKTIKVATMHQRGRFPVVSSTGFRAIRLPYQSNSLSMVVVLPDALDGATSVAQRLGVTELQALFAALQSRDVYTDLSLPRFKANFAAELKEDYRLLGLIQAFDKDRADFSGITGRPNNQVKAWIDTIMHRAVVEVAEEGTEAAAATTIGIELQSARPPDPPVPEPFKVDRPFLFFITDDNSGATLFAGRISDPSETD